MLSTHVLITILAALATTVHGHGAMVAVIGANNITGMGLGINPATPRDGSTRNPFEQDTSIINDKEIAKGKASPCGRTPGGGVNDIAAGVASAASTGLPSLTANGQISMTLHQVNQDGAGPYTCEMSTDATGATFVPMTVITNVPGVNSRSRAKATDFPLVAQGLPGTTCTGGPNGDACIVRCRNSARAGPFGGCAVVTNATPPSAAVAPSTSSNSSAAVAPSASSTALAEVAPSASSTSSAEVAPPLASALPVLNDTFVAAQPAADGDQADEEDKRSLVESITNLLFKRDHSGKRMLNSRIVEMQRRGQWI